MWSCLTATLIVKPSKKIAENMPIYVCSIEENKTRTFSLSKSNLMSKKPQRFYGFLFHRKSSVREMHHRRKKTKVKKNKQLQRNHTVKIAASNFRRLFALEGKQKIATSFTSPSWCLRFSYIN